MPKKSTKNTSKRPPAKGGRGPRMSSKAARAEGDEKTRRALAQAKAVTDANLKAIAAADQENAAKRDERGAASDGMTASERAVAAAGKPSRPRVSRRWSGLNLAAEIVAAAKEPMSARAIAERAVEAGWKTSGKTPHATLHAAMSREIAAKGEAARFLKTGRGLFAAGKGA